MDLQKIINNSDDADSAALTMYSMSEADPSDRRLMYLVSVSLLVEKFGKIKAMSALHDFATFDYNDANKFVRRAARSFEYRYLMWTNHPKFIKELNENGIAGFETGELLYVAHKCVKPNSKTWQCTSFGKGIGPLGDSQFDSPEQIISPCVTGMGIPPHATFLTLERLMKVESRYMPQ
jgi:hypothetical protein